MKSLVKALKPPVMTLENDFEYLLGCKVGAFPCVVPTYTKPVEVAIAAEYKNAVRYII